MASSLLSVNIGCTRRQWFAQTRFIPLGSLSSESTSTDLADTGWHEKIESGSEVSSFRASKQISLAKTVQSAIDNLVILKSYTACRQINFG